MYRCVLCDLVHVKILGFVVLAWGIVRGLPLHKNISKYIFSTRFCKYKVPFLSFGDVGLVVKVASSKARHLKSFL